MTALTRTLNTLLTCLADARSILDQVMTQPEQVRREAAADGSISRQLALVREKLAQAADALRELNEGDL
jgi:hypothetical protein